MIIRIHPKQGGRVSSRRILGILPHPIQENLWFSQYGVIKIKPLRCFFGAMRIIIKFIMQNYEKKVVNLKLIFNFAPSIQ